MKTIILILAFIPSFSSCSYKDISRKAQLTEATIRVKIVSGKRYKIKLNSGAVIKVKVTAVDSLNFYGQQTIFINRKKTFNTFSESYSGLHKNASSISVRKFSPGITAAILIPIGIGIGWAISEINYYPY